MRHPAVGTVLLVGAGVACWALTTGAFARLPWPATPDLLLGLVAAVAGAATGRRAVTLGALAGVAAGLLVDLAPPTTTVVGTQAACYAAAGAAAGAVARLGWRWWPAGVLAGGVVAGLAHRSVLWVLGLAQTGDVPGALGTPALRESLLALPVAAAVQLGVAVLVTLPVARALLPARPGPGGRR